MEQYEFVNREQVNFFHFVGQRYPEVNITTSDNRMFASLFRHKKAFIILKSTDVDQMHDVESMNLELYRKGVMFFLCIKYHILNMESPIMTFLPINAKLDNLPTPYFPEIDEVMQFEIHLLNYFHADRLEKVLQFHIEDVEFQQTLVELYEHQQSSNYDDAIAKQDTKAFFRYPFKKLDTFLVAHTKVSIDKQQPSEFEPSKNDNHTMVATMQG
ncbi:hypothetical protein [Vibrio harveyi]|uniref:hypothetical protein n=1 Tax=Vibrio harveyi TaxID=669 RepID=UPI0024815217|nr:hypothetical protein [Vibrio harveyi]